MTNKSTVLVAGATGMLGTKIVSALLDKGDVNVRAMVRSINDTKPKNRQKIDAMKAKGATIVEGDVMQPETLLTPCTGVDVVVSAIGNTDATVPGQKHLIDTAKYVAVAVSDPGLANKALEVAGDTLTAKQLKATYEEATGTKLTEKLLGSVTEFKAWIAAKKAAASKLEEYVYHQYIYAMVSGKGKLDRIENDYLSARLRQRYPQIHPTTVKQFLSTGA